MDNTTIVVVEDDRKRWTWLLSHVRYLTESPDTLCENGELGIGVVVDKWGQLTTIETAESGALARREGVVYHRCGNRLKIVDKGQTIQLNVSSHDDESIRDAFCGFAFNYLVVNSPEAVSKDSYARVAPVLAAQGGPREVVLFTKQKPAVEGDNYVLGSFRVPVANTTLL